MKKFTLNEEQLVNVKEKYKNGMTIKQIAKEYSCASVTMSNVFKENNIQIQRPGNHKIILSEEALEEIESLYLNGETPEKIGELFSVSRQTVSRRLQNRGYDLIKDKFRETYQNPSILNIVGERYGELKVVKMLEVDKDRGSKCLCECKCGNLNFVCYTNSLRSGHTKSCGCISSAGETEIKQTLEENNIQFEQQKTFSDLKSDKGYFLKFDFAIYNHNIFSHLIEFDGPQHYNKNNAFYSEDLVKRDIQKNKYCSQNNIKLIRIPYSKKNKIKLEDLVLWN